MHSNSYRKGNQSNNPRIIPDTQAIFAQAVFADDLATNVDRRRAEDMNYGWIFYDLARIPDSQIGFGGSRQAKYHVARYFSSLKISNLAPQSEQM